MMVTAMRLMMVVVVVVRLRANRASLASCRITPVANRARTRYFCPLETTPRLQPGRMHHLFPCPTSTDGARPTTITGNNKPLLRKCFFSLPPPNLPLRGKLEDVVARNNREINEIKRKLRVLFMYILDCDATQDDGDSDGEL